MQTTNNSVIGSFFCSDELAEFNGCPIYTEQKVVGKEYWNIQLIFFRGSKASDRFCLRLYKGIYNGEYLQDSSINVTRINMNKPEYIVLPDINYNLNRNELNKFISIISERWDQIMSILNEEKICYTEDMTTISLEMPDYNLL